MANLFVRSTDGSDADNGTTWALAKATLTGVAAIDAAGDVVWVSQVHAETTAAAISFDWEPTTAGNIRILCGNDGAEPPTALATSGSISTSTGTGTITLSGTQDRALYIYGLGFHAGVGASGASHIQAGTAASIYFERCVFDLAETGGTARIIMPNNQSGHFRFKDCDFQFSHASHSLQSNGGHAVFEGGSILVDTAITLLWASTVGGTRIEMSGVDLSNGAAAMNIANNTSDNVIVLLRNCKMPASWSGSVNSGTPGEGSIYQIQNSDSADTNYRLEKKTQFGTVTHETTVIKTGGASDGTTGLSWKMVAHADAEWNHQTLDSPEIVKWNETTGSPITVTVDILHDSVTNITDKGIWLEVQYLGTSGTTLSLFVDDAAADYITAAADQADSSATWTTTGMTNPNTQKLNVTFTPQKKGFIHAVVKLAQASKTVYIDPELQVS